MFATSKASTKLPHCGSAGQSSPLGSVPDGCSAVVNMLTNGRSVTAIRTQQQRPAGVELASGDPHRSLPSGQPLDRQDDDQDEHHQHDRERRGQADLALEEGE